jgi:hypothetical protein
MGGESFERIKCHIQPVDFVDNGDNDELASLVVVVIPVIHEGPQAIQQVNRLFLFVALRASMDFDKKRI